jgi:hypothetical protein
VVVRYEERCCQVCCPLRHLSVSQSRASTTSWITAVVASARVEVERDCHGLYHGFAKTQSGYDSIWVIVDRLTKVAHFIPVKTTYSGPQLAELYILRIVCRRRLCLTEGLSLLQSFGRGCMKPWIPNCILVCLSPSDRWSN